jgi:hypothetical protein
LPGNEEIAVHFSQNLLARREVILTVEQQ